MPKAMRGTLLTHVDFGTYDLNFNDSSTITYVPAEYLEEDDQVLLITDKTASNPGVVQSLLDKDCAVIPLDDDMYDLDGLNPDELFKQVFAQQTVLTTKVKFYEVLWSDGTTSQHTKKELCVERWDLRGMYHPYNGDHLTIFDKDDPTKIVWKGKIQHRKGSQHQKGVDRKTWEGWFLRKHPAELVLKKGRTR